MRRAIALAAAFVFGLTVRAGCENSAGADYTTGDGFRGFDVKGSVNFDEKGDWLGDAAFSYAHNKIGTESKVSQVSAGLDHTIDDNWNAHGRLTWSKDSISTVRYIGPTFGAEYSAKDADRLFDVSLDADLFFYQTDTNISASTISARGRQVFRAAHKGSISLAQFHPYLRADKPLWSERVTPYALAGYYFYSKDPNQIEQLVGRPRFAASAGALSAMVGGFFRENLEAGVDAALPAGFRLHGALGVERLVTDNSWATTQDLRLTRRFHDRVKVKLDWAVSIQDGARQDFYTTGFTYYF